MELSERLHAVASMVTAGYTAADVGCDHGYVSIWLVQNNICPKVIAMDVNKGPLARARENIQIYGLSQYIETRLSNGVEALFADEADTLVCAGMGGKLMAQILLEGMDKISRMKELVLQPQSELQEMRAFLRKYGMQIIAENMVRDENKFYPMMKVMVKGKDIDCENDTDWDIRMKDTYGPCLLQQGHPILKQYLKKRYDVCENIIGQLGCKDNKGVDEAETANKRQLERMEQLKEEMRDIDKVLHQYF